MKSPIGLLDALKQLLFFFLLLINHGLAICDTFDSDNLVTWEDRKQESGSPCFIRLYLYYC